LKSRRLRLVLERCLAALFAVLAVSVWPAAFWHEATTVHVVCAEHGELVDVPAPGCASNESDELGADLDAQAPEEHGHDHCPFVTLGQPSEPAPVARAAGVRLVEVAGVCPPGGQTRRVSVPILLQAPKQSPPS
jgi:hypothetical protein